MKFLKRKFSLMLILVLVLLPLLPSLAVLQYRWLGQVSQGERERMQASLRAGVNHFSEDFDRELTRAFLTLQMDATTLRDKAWKNYADRYDHWLSTAPHPQLIKNMFLVDADESGNLRLAKFDRVAKEFKPAVWPAEFTDFRDRCEQEYRQINSEAPLLIQSSLPLVAEEIPALVIPVFPVSSLPTIPPSVVEMKLDFVHLFAYTVITLNIDYIKQEFIPALTKRYFANGDRLDYNLAIVSSSDPKKIVYQSDPHLTDEALASSDATAGLLRVRFDEFDSLFLDRAEGKRLFFGRPGFQSRHTAISIYRRLPEGESKNSEVTRVVKSDTNDKAPWQLILKHRSGSLEAAVANVRRRNLIISFGILLLLAVSVAMIIISTRRAQRLARQQIEFVAGVSHELRTPLAVICSAGENLADGLINDPQQVKRYGALIESEGRRLADMVEQVLEFAGRQSDRKTHQPQPIQVAGLVENALAACGSLIAEGSFQIEQEIEPTLPMVMADPLALQRSVQNLLNNALKYSGESRWIGIRARRSGQEVQITIEDKGLGISPSELPHIFEPFYRGQEMIAAQIHGSGLGLSLVKQIVEASGGRVSVESVLGRGSSFTLHLPAVAQSDEASSEPAKEKYEQANFSR